MFVKERKRKGDYIKKEKDYTKVQDKYTYVSKTSITFRGEPEHAQTCTDLGNDKHESMTATHTCTYNTDLVHEYLIVTINVGLAHAHTGTVTVQYCKLCTCNMVS